MTLRTEGEAGNNNNTYPDVGRGGRRRRRRAFLLGVKGPRKKILQYSLVYYERMHTLSTIILDGIVCLLREYYTVILYNRGMYTVRARIHHVCMHTRRAGEKAAMPRGGGDSSWYVC